MEEEIKCYKCGSVNINKQSTDNEDTEECVCNDCGTEFLLAWI